MSFLEQTVGGLFGDGDGPSVSDYLLSQGGGGAPSPSNSGDWSSGFLQSLTSLGTGYLSKRMDVDIQNRVVGMQPIPMLRTTQNGVSGYGQIVNTPGGRVASVNLSAMMPLILVGAAVFMLARKR